MDATNASGPDLDRGVLPGQQAVVHCRISVKVEDFLNSFFIHSIFVQTLSDMCVLLSPVRQGDYPAMRLNVCDAITRLTSEKASDRMSVRGRAARGYFKSSYFKNILRIFSLNKELFIESLVNTP